MSIGDQNKSQLGGSGIYAKTRVGRIRFFMLDSKYVMNSQQSEQQIFDKKNYFLPWAISHLGQVAVNMFIWLMTVFIIQTTDLCDWKRPLYQLSHNHCPIERHFTFN